MRRRKNAGDSRSKVHLRPLKKQEVFYVKYQFVAFLKLALV